MTPRNDVYKAIDSERDYQDSLGKERARSPGIDSLTQAENLVLISHYLRKAEDAWVLNPGEAVEETQNILRKIAGICVRTMEKYGSPLRK